MFSTWYEIVIFIVLILATGFAAGAWAAVKNALKETKDVLDVVVAALADDKVDNNEIARIIKEAQECGLSWKKAVQSLLDLLKKKRPETR